MTIHAAKGLEFPVVAVADLGRRPQSGDPAVLVDDHRLGIRLPSVAGGREYGLDYQALRDARRQAEAAEEDRVLYVGLTRAQERLILSGALKLDPWPDMQRNGVPPIAWLAPSIAGHTPSADDPETREHGVRVLVNTPATVGKVLRPGALAPAGTELPAAPPPPARHAQPTPAPPPPAIRALSYSALQLWKQCGYRFYLQRVLGLPEEKERGFREERTPEGFLDARLRGSLVHAALEREGDPRELVQQTAEAWRVEITAEELDDMAGLVAGYAGSETERRVAAAAHVRREHTFSFPIGTTMLTGVVDVLAIEDDGHALVVDYKSDRLAPEDTPQALVERDYGVQQRLYALAALRSGVPSAEVVYVLLERPGEPVRTLYDPTDVPRLESEVAELARGVREGRFEVAPEPHLGLCAGCPGRRALCSWPEDMTGRELPLAPDLPGD
jgi:ATP-dependent exoDNAse (exonuclease V) beta subunit